MPRLRDRVACRLRAGALDRAIASGASSGDAVLALRAGELVRRCQREELASGLRRVLRAAGRDPLVRREVLRGRAELARLASRLQAPGPVEARGVAQVRLLLTDGTGPLYNRGDVRAAAERALAALAPRGTG
jgi:hypothetical protein